MMSVKNDKGGFGDQRGGGLRNHLRHGELVNIVSLETFIGMANRGQL